MRVINRQGVDEDVTVPEDRRREIEHNVKRVLEGSEVHHYVFIGAIQDDNGFSAFARVQGDGFTVTAMMADLLIRNPELMNAVQEELLIRALSGQIGRGEPA